jgi:hypothetical protein
MQGQKAAETKIKEARAEAIRKKAEVAALRWKLQPAGEAQSSSCRIYGAGLSRCDTKF